MAYRTEMLLGVGLVILIAIAFGRLIDADFTNYDDDLYVTRNPHVLTGLTFANVQWAFSTFDYSNWHPLTWLSLQLDRTIFGPKAAGFHATNIILHGLNALLLFCILRRMTGAVWRSWFVAAFFAVHPLHVESVAWVAERKDVLSGLFWMLTLGAYVLYTEKPGVQRYGVVLVLFALGLMAKPMLVTLPFVLLLLDYWPLGRLKSWRVAVEKAPLLILAGLSSAITLRAQSAGGALKSLDLYSFSTRSANAVLAYVSYLRQTFWPRNLAVLYPHDLPDWTEGRVVGAAGLLLCLTAVFICLGKKRHYFAVGWLWFLGALAPVIGLVQVGVQSHADRYTYLPIIGLFILIIWGITDLAARGRFKKLLMGAGFGAVLTCSMLSLIQAGYWQDSVILWDHALMVAKSNPVAHHNLGIALAQAGKPDEALFHLSKALELDPGSSENHYNLAVAVLESDPGRATQEFAETVRLNPDHLQSHRNLARLYGKEGKQKEAIEELHEILRLDPDDFQARISLGLTYMKQFDMEQARRQFAEAARIQPRTPEPHNYLGLTYTWHGDYAQACLHYREALRFNPSYAEAMSNLGVALGRQGNWKEARVFLTRAVAIEPRAVGFHCQLALVLNELGQPAAAQKEYEAASRLKPDWPQEASKHAWRLATDRDDNHRSAGEALFLAQEACQATATQPRAEFLDTLAAAQAEAGRFDEAVATAKKALALASPALGSERIAAMQSRLRLYEAHQPYREASAAKP
ncbi:MAG: tetratricopeptide repeat protein [Gemmataceae bacterium]